MLMQKESGRRDSRPKDSEENAGEPKAPSFGQYRNGAKNNCQLNAKLA
jgi:hypothetical protein